MLRILANENPPGEAVQSLRQAGHDVAWARIDAPGQSDEVLLAQAGAEARILITFDKDFGELAFRRGLPALSGIILFRTKTQSSAQATALILETLHSRSDRAGHFSVVEADRIRMRPLPEARKG